ncbi:polyribonucleotide nucleotidyltransferase [Thermomonas sp.]|uniref:polyribonucleotide nucleotidyltransferase n=1 Tax=Thermomonas sp. TaxID=1971895 RepID=UPI00257EA3FE|nr:polyribonucleotide nucleotidyltransferase [Thermomonas sp.]
MKNTSATGPIVKRCAFGAHELILETGQIAKQASGAVMVRLGDTVVLVTAVGSKRAKDGLDFFPLTVEYRERFYAGGRIPGGFFKREGRPTEKEILTSRLIDRPIRPLFPDQFRNEVQVIATVLSIDPLIDPDIPALIGASAALRLSGLPFKGPIGAVRVGRRGDSFLVNPTTEELQESDLDLVVAGTRHGVLMVESEANLLSEATMLEAVSLGHRAMQTVIDSIEELADAAGVTPWEWSHPPRDLALADAVRVRVGDSLTRALLITDRIDRKKQVKAIRSEMLTALGVATSSIGWSAAEVRAELDELEYAIVRRMVLQDQRRLDGRGLADVRSISSTVGVLPRTHGSALFTRGETQALVTATLGTARDGQVVDAVTGEYKEHFLFHYNFPPYCVGETGPMIGPKRREIGHGRLAKRGVAAIMPSMESFPYTIRMVSEITESNGSSSMASVCGSSLALMDAGVPVKGPIAGIAMGLVKEGDRFAVLSDILGDEDHLGDMDFKVAGTVDGVSALQMDIKIDGVTAEIMQVALAQAREGRLHILREMAKTIRLPREDMSMFAPRLLTLKVHPDKIREVIGKGGATIQALTRETGTQIDIRDDGTIVIASTNGAAADAARKRIEQITAEIEPGRIYEGRVAKVLDFGAFVTIAPGKDGLVHVSQISEERVENASEALSEGDMVKVKVLEVDRQGRVRLSMKAVGADEGVTA